MKKWVLSATVYLIVVIGVYYAFSAIVGPVDSSDHSNTEQHDK